jgi:hypothetical protein
VLNNKWDLSVGEGKNESILLQFSLYMCDAYAGWKALFGLNNQVSKVTLTCQHWTSFLACPSEGGCRVWGCRALTKWAIVVFFISKVKQRKLGCSIPGHFATWSVGHFAQLCAD